MTQRLNAVNGGRGCWDLVVFRSRIFLRGAIQTLAACARPRILLVQKMMPLSCAVANGPTRLFAPGAPMAPIGVAAPRWKRCYAQSSWGCFIFPKPNRGIRNTRSISRIVRPRYFGQRNRRHVGIIERKPKCFRYLLRLAGMLKTLGSGENVFRDINIDIRAGGAGCSHQNRHDFTINGYNAVQTICRGFNRNIWRAAGDFGVQADP